MATHRSNRLCCTNVLTKFLLNNGLVSPLLALKLFKRGYLIELSALKILILGTEKYFALNYFNFQYAI